MFDGLLSPIHAITAQPAIRAGGTNEYKPHGTKINKYSMSGELVQTYETLSMASREMGITVQAIQRRLQKGDNAMGGFQWKLEVSDER